MANTLATRSYVAATSRCCLHQMIRAPQKHLAMASRRSMLPNSTNTPSFGTMLRVIDAGGSVPKPHRASRMSDRIGFPKFTTKATLVNETGSIDSSAMQSMEKKIKEQLSAEIVTVRDAYGDGRHVSIDVVASAFEGQSAVNRQRMVYKAIWEELQSTVHAVDHMTTKTPSEATEGK